MKTSMKDRNIKFIFTADFLLIITVWGSFFREGFGCDTIFGTWSPLSAIDSLIADGRYLAFLVSYIPYCFGMNAARHYKLFFVIFLLLIIAALFVIQLAFMPVAKIRLHGLFDCFLYVLITGLIYVNVFFAEYFYFTECFLSFGCGLLCAALCVLAATRKHYISGCILLAASCLFYQTFMIMAVLLIGSYMVMEDGFAFSTKLVLREFILGIAAVVIGAIDLFSVSVLVHFGLYDTSAKSVQTDIASNLSVFMEQLDELFYSGLQLLPPFYVPALMLLGSIVIIMICLSGKKEHPASEYGTFSLLLLMHAILVFSLSFLMGGHFYPRMLTLFFTSVSVLFLICFLLIPDRGRNPFFGFIAVSLVIQVIFIQVIMSGRYVSNGHDRMVAELAVEELNRYEEVSGVKVKKFASCADSECRHYYDDILFKRDQINERVLGLTTYSLFRVISGRDEIDNMPMPDSVYQEYFEGRNWEHFDAEDQIVFEGDTMYWCVY